MSNERIEKFSKLYPKEILTIGDRVLFRRDNQLYEGVIKSINDGKVEIDDKSIKLIVCAISKNTIADNISFSNRV